MRRYFLRPQYPAAERQEMADTRDNVIVHDPYRWLEDLTDSRTIDWAKAQDALCAERRDDRQVEHLYAALAPLAKVGAVSPPMFRGESVFFTRRKANEDLPSLLIELAGEERVLVNPLAEDASGRTVLGAWRPSNDGKRVAYQLSVDGNEESWLYVMEVATRTLIDGPIDRVRDSPIAWLPDGEHYYYVRRLADLDFGEKHYHRRVYLHEVGSDPDNDIEIFGAGREKTQYYTVDVTGGDRWLQITATSGTDRRNDIWLADLNNCAWDEPKLRPVQVEVDHHTTLQFAPGTQPNDRVWLATTMGAPAGRVMTVKPSMLDADWCERIAPRQDVVLSDFAVLNGPKLPKPLALTTWSRHAVSEILIHDLDSGEEVGTVPLPGVGSVGSLVTRREAGHEAWFEYTDYHTPTVILRFDALMSKTGRWQDGQSPVNVSRLVTRQLECKSEDGTTVRIFTISSTGSPDGPRPTILSGYGGFGRSLSPAYSADVQAWVEAGGVYAVASLRGGGEEGEEWHRAGRGLNKHRTFDDFHAATRCLINSGWTRPEKLGIMGGSNGGLLVGAALTQHPENYAAAVCVSGLLDMVRYEKFGLGQSWRSEYGSVDNVAEFHALMSYSPYHRVVAGVKYPPVLFVSADGDTRVDPMHSRKMCAALQHASAGAGPVLLRRVRGVGHRAWALSQAVTLQAECLSFLATHLALDLNVRSL